MALVAHHRQPLGLGHREKRLAVFRGQRLPNRLEIIAGVKPFGNLADVFTQGLAIAEERRTREHVDLGAGIVDVIFSDNIEACELKQAGQCIAKDRAAAVADMHRPGRISRDVFDIDLLARPDRALTVSVALAQHRPQRVCPGRYFQSEIDETWTGNIHRGDQIVGAHPLGDLFCEVAGFGLCFLGEHHGSVGRHVAMGRVLRRLDHHPRQVRARPKFRRADGVYARKHLGEKMLFRRCIGHGRRLT